MVADKKAGKGKNQGKKPTKSPPKIHTGFVLRDECLAPFKNIYFYYTGPNPYLSASKLWGYIDKFFEVSSAGFGEPEFYWDTSGDPITYTMKWWVRKSLSRYSEIRWDIMVQGDEGAQTKKGRFTLEITANINHRIPSSWLHRSFWWIYQYLFYTRRRMEYLKYCRKYALGFREFAKKTLGLTTSSAKEPEMKDLD